MPKRVRRKSVKRRKNTLRRKNTFRRNTKRINIKRIKNTLHKRNMKCIRNTLRRRKIRGGGGSQTKEKSAQAAAGPKSLPSPDMGGQLGTESGLSGLSGLSGPLLEHKFLDYAKTYNWSAVKKILDTHPDLINVSPKNRWTALHQAVHRNNKDMVEYLLKRGANTHIVSKGQTPKEVPGATPEIINLLNDYSSIPDLGGDTFDLDPEPQPAVAQAQPPAPAPAAATPPWLGSPWKVESAPVPQPAPAAAAAAAAAAATAAAPEERLRRENSPLNWMVDKLMFMKGFFGVGGITTTLLSLSVPQLHVVGVGMILIGLLIYVVLTVLKKSDKGLKESLLQPEQEYRLESANENLSDEQRMLRQVRRANNELKRRALRIKGEKDENLHNAIARGMPIGGSEYGGSE